MRVIIEVEVDEVDGDSDSEICLNIKENVKDCFSHCPYDAVVTDVYVEED